MNRNITIALMAAIAFSPIVALKAASLIELSQNYELPVNVESDLNVDANLDAGVDTELEANDNGQSELGPAADADMDAVVDANVDANLGADLSAEVLTVTREELEDEANMSAVAEFRSSARQAAELSSANLDAEGNVVATAGLPGIPNTGVEDIRAEAEGVATQEDLRLFALASMESDESLEAMSFESGRILVSYDAKGHFIGILPVEMETDVIVDQEGEVEIDFPWYGFLVAKGEDELREAIQAEVDAVLSSTAEGGWTNYDRAQVAAAIVSAIRTHYATETATSTEATQ